MRIQYDRLPGAGFPTDEEIFVGFGEGIGPDTGGRMRGALLGEEYMGIMKQSFEGGRDPREREYYNRDIQSHTETIEGQRESIEERMRRYMGANPNAKNAPSRSKMISTDEYLRPILEEMRRKRDQDERGMNPRKEFAKGGPVYAFGGGLMLPQGGTTGRGTNRTGFTTYDLERWEQFPDMRTNVKGQEGWIHEEEDARPISARFRGKLPRTQMGGKKVEPTFMESMSEPDASDMLNPLSIFRKPAGTIIGNLTKRFKDIPGIGPIRDARAGVTRGLKGRAAGRAGAKGYEAAEEAGRRSFDSDVRAAAKPGSTADKIVDEGLSGLYSSPAHGLRRAGGAVGAFSDKSMIDFGMQHGRPMVTMQMPNGKKMLFYQSAGGTDGKEVGQWFAIGGAGKHAGEGGDWFIKGSIPEVSAGYGDKNVQQAMEFLNKRWVSTDTDQPVRWAFDRQLAPTGGVPLSSGRGTLETKAGGASEELFQGSPWEGHVRGRGVAEGGAGRGRWHSPEFKDYIETAEGKKGLLGMSESAYGKAFPEIQSRGDQILNWLHKNAALHQAGAKVDISKWKHFGDNFEEIFDNLSSAYAKPDFPMPGNTPLNIPKIMGPVLTPEGTTAGYLQGFAKGGGVDSVPAMLTPGEFVVRKAAVDAVGVGALQNINRMGFNAGGMVPEYLQFGGFPEPAFAARGIGYGVTEPAFATRGGGQTAGVGIDSGVIVSAIQQLQSTVSTEIQDLTAAMTTQQGQQGQVDLSPITALNNTLTGLTQWEGFNVFSEAVKMLGGIGPFQVEVPGGINVNLGSFEAALISQISTIVTNAVRQALADQPKTPVADNNSADGKFNNNV